MYMNGCFKESTWLFKAFIRLIYEPRHSFDLRLPMSFTGLVMFTALRITQYITTFFKQKLRKWFRNVRSKIDGNINKRSVTCFSDGSFIYNKISVYC